MMNLKFLIACLFIVLTQVTNSQSLVGNSSRNLNERHCADNTIIPGAPNLGAPTLLLGDKEPLQGEGMGWAAPSVFDWNKDGKKDLLIGEFGSGLEKGQDIGNFIRVYLNIGSDSMPAFNGEYKYAMPAFGEGKGTPISIFTTCCMAIRPQFIDLDNDGFQDIVTGQYFPGEVTLFRGTRKGFLSGELLSQKGNPAADDPKLPITDINSVWYWNYSSVDFGDFDNDGDFDMIIGGAALRISENIGSASEPKFSERKLLLDEQGSPLKVFAASEDQLAHDPWTKYYLVGVYHSVPLVVDWDNDKQLDLLVTTGHYKKGEPTITFFKGIKSNSGYRFKKGIPIFFEDGNLKSFPGSWIVAHVTDWNNDGTKDLLLGASIVTINGKLDLDLSWNWEDETDILKKNPGFSRSRGANNSSKYPTLVHKGYVYLLLGK